MNPVLTPDFIGKALDLKHVRHPRADVTLGFIHEGGGDVTVVLFDDEDQEIAKALVHLTGEGQ